MSVIRWHQRKSRLTAMIDRPGGLSVGRALVSARENLDKLSGESRRIVAARVAELEALPEPGPSATEAAAARAQAYGLAGDVIDAAGPFDLDDICAAAAGLCDLIDAAEPHEPFDWRIVTVHAQALRLLLSLPPEAKEARKVVLDNLRLVLKKKIPLYLEE